MAWSNAVTVLRLLEGKWTLPILARLRSGASGLAALRDALLGEPSMKILQESLRRLEEVGIVQRHVLSSRPPRVEFHLTVRGHDLVALLDELESPARRAWGTGNEHVRS